MPLSFRHALRKRCQYATRRKEVDSAAAFDARVPPVSRAATCHTRLRALQRWHAQLRRDGDRMPVRHKQRSFFIFTPPVEACCFSPGFGGIRHAMPLLDFHTARHVHATICHALILA